MECYNQFKSYINAIIVKYKRKCNQWQKLKIITFTLISFVVVCLVSSKLIKFNLQNVSKTKSYSERRTKNSAIIKVPVDYNKIELDYTKIRLPSDKSRLFDNGNYFSDLVSTHKCNIQPIKLLIIVTSHPNGRSRRNRIRKSWGSPKSNYVKTFYIVGKVNNVSVMDELLKEENLHKDIIRGDFIENHYNLSRKLQTGFEWSYKNCMYKYVLKCDDDVFVNVNFLIETLDRKYGKLTTLYLGHAKYKDPVVRNSIDESEKRYNVNLKEYNGTHYPPYCSGGAFIFSRDVLTEIIPFMDKTRYFKLDDIYISFLVHNANIKALDDSIFDRFGNADVEETEKSCSIDDKIAIFHPVKTEFCHGLLNTTLYGKKT